MAALALNVEPAFTLRYGRTCVLRNLGFRVSEASTGEDAVAQAAVCRPNLVVLSLVLPDSTGFDIFHRLRADSTTATAPVLLVSDHYSAADLERSRAEGVDAHIVADPLDTTTLVEALREVVADLERAVERRRNETAKLVASMDASRFTGDCLLQNLEALRQVVETSPRLRRSVSPG